MSNLKAGLEKVKAGLARLDAPAPPRADEGLVRGLEKVKAGLARLDTDVGAAPRPLASALGDVAGTPDGPWGPAVFRPPRVPDFGRLADLVRSPKREVGQVAPELAPELAELALSWPVAQPSPDCAAKADTWQVDAPPFLSAPLSPRLAAATCCSIRLSRQRSAPSLPAPESAPDVQPAPAECPSHAPLPTRKPVPRREPAPELREPGASPRGASAPELAQRAEPWPAKQDKTVGGLGRTPVLLAAAAARERSPSPRGIGTLAKEAGRKTRARPSSTGRAGGQRAQSPIRRGVQGRQRAQSPRPSPRPAQSPRVRPPKLDARADLRPQEMEEA